MKTNEHGEPHKEPSQIAISQKIAQESLEYLDSFEDEYFPVGGDILDNDENIETDLFQYEEKLSENNYIVLERNSDLYIDRIESYE